MSDDEIIKQSEDETIKRLDALIEDGSLLAKQFHPNYYSTPSLVNLDWYYTINISYVQRTNLLLWRVEATNVLAGLLPLTRIDLENLSV